MMKKTSISTENIAALGIHTHWWFLALRCSYVALLTLVDTMSLMPAAVGAAARKLESNLASAILD